MVAFSHARVPQHPAIVVGLGAFGAELAKRLIAERADELSQSVLSTGHSLDAVILERTEDVELATARVVAAARRALAHDRQVELRDDAALEGPGRLVVLVLAHLGEPSVRARIGALVTGVQRRLMGELGPIFETFRTGARRNAVVLPVLAMPHPPAHVDGEQVSGSLRELLTAVVATPSGERAVPSVFAIEDVAELTVLSESELAACIRNFASMLLYAPLRSDELEAITAASDPNEPLATFVCATAELHRPRLAAYGANMVALEVLDAVASEPRRDASLHELDALEELEAGSWKTQSDAAADVREVLTRYGVAVEPTAALRWWERGDVVRDRLGPDPGDPSTLDAFPPAEPPQGWALHRMREIEETWRLLQRTRFDDVVERDRADNEAWRDALLDRLHDRIDRELWETPSPAAVRRTQELLDNLTRAFREQLDGAVAERDSVTPATAPEFSGFRDAHARHLDAARAKPDPDRLLVWGLLAWAAVAVLLPPVLRMLADAFELDGTAWYTPWFRARADYTAILCGLLAVGGPLAWMLARAQLRVLATAERMWTALSDTVTGDHGSLLAYFSTRLRLSRAIARVEMLLAVSAAIEADRRRLILLDKAVRRGAAQLRDELRSLGVASTPEGLDLAPMLGAQGTLCESFVGIDAAHEIGDALTPAGREGRVHAVFEALARHYRDARRWRQEVPFTSLLPLRRAAALHAEPIATWDPFAGAERAAATAAHLAGFVRRQVRSLRGALNLSGYEDLDRSGVARPFRDGQAFVPRAVMAMVDEQLRESAIRSRVRPIDAEDRAYYLMVQTGIDVVAVASLRPREPAATGPRLLDLDMASDADTLAGKPGS